MKHQKRIAVVGAGLGGLSVAGFLQRAGFDVTIYEQAPAFSRIGAGIILSANVMKALRRLGVERPLVETGIKPHSYISRAWDTGENGAKARTAVKILARNFNIESVLMAVSPLGRRLIEPPSLTKAERSRKKGHDC